MARAPRTPTSSPATSPPASSSAASRPSPSPSPPAPHHPQSQGGRGGARRQPGSPPPLESRGAHAARRAHPPRHHHTRRDDAARRRRAAQHRRQPWQRRHGQRHRRGARPHAAKGTPRPAPLCSNRQRPRPFWRQRHRHSGIIAGKESRAAHSQGRIPAHVSVLPDGAGEKRPIDARVGGQSSGPGGGNSSPIASGMLAIRPTAVRLCTAESESARLRGPVADTAFRGRHYELVVDIGSWAVGDLQYRHRERAAGPQRRGTAVGVQLEAAGCIVFSKAEHDPSTRAGE